jgi:bacteriocin biosynthesis cyclodehydratase domain-containing protein
MVPDLPPSPPPTPTPAANAALPVGGARPAAARALPAAVRLARHRSVLPLCPTARVVGLDPETALVVDDLPPPLAALLDRLDRPAVTAELVAAATAGGVPAEIVRDLLVRLVEAGALVDAAEPERAARARAAGVVSVRGRGPLAVGIVAGLLHNGIGTVHTDTGGVVNGGDLGTGYTDADRGGERLAATQAAVRRLLPGAVTRAPPMRSRPDLVVLADETPGPTIAEQLRTNGVAHLAARLRDGVGIVGPLVYPGRTACMSCLDLTRGDLDPRWPAVAAQLAGRAGVADPAAATATVGLAVAQAVAAIEERHPVAPSTTLELDVETGELHRRFWSAHPDCPCGAAPVDRASQVRGETIMR